MARESPLNSQHEAVGAVAAPYGREGQAISVLQVYSGIDREYAALRKSAAIFDLPHRTTLTVTGPDRLPFLNRMLTQELKDLVPGQARRSFWLNRKGRIDADLVVVALPDRIILDVDIHAAPRTLDGLNSFVIADDLAIEPAGATHHRLSLHGPLAAGILAGATAPAAGAPPVDTLRPGEAAICNNGDLLVWRLDSCGEPGFELSLPTSAAPALYAALAEPLEAIAQQRDRADRGFALHEAGSAAPAHAIRGGWHAFNLARLEAGTPLYYIDFGPDTLPHETGEAVLLSRVSFKKGCYLGQEVVARMQSLGHPKQRLVALDFPDLPSPTPDAATPLPVSGASITATAGSPDPIGAVTSSGPSPMLGSSPAVFAMVKYKHSAPGAELFVHSEDGPPLRAQVRTSMVYWQRTAHSS